MFSAWRTGATASPMRARISGPSAPGSRILIDYGKLAGSLGMWSAGPITDPSDLAPALKKAVQVVKAGEPALVDVVTQPR